MPYITLPLSLSVYEWITFRITDVTSLEQMKLISQLAKTLQIILSFTKSNKGMNMNEHAHTHTDAYI